MFLTPLLLAVLAGSGLASPAAAATAPRSSTLRIQVRPGGSEAGTLAAATQQGLQNSLTYPAYNAKSKELHTYSVSYHLDGFSGTNELKTSEALLQDASGSQLFFASRIAYEHAPGSQADDKSWGDRLRRSIKQASSSSAGDEELVRRSQIVFGSSTSSDKLEPDVLLLSDDYAILSVSTTVDGDRLASRIDAYLPFDSYISRMPQPPAESLLASTPLAHANNDGEAPEKPNPTYRTVRYNPLIAHLLNDADLSQRSLRTAVRVLSGEEQARALNGTGIAAWRSRHSATFGARSAAQWLLHEVREALIYEGALPHAKCNLWEYDPWYSPDVICEIPATLHDEGAARGTGAETETTGPEGGVLISAHYDSRGTFGSTLAGGADDDGSGTAALLAVARVLGNNGVRFARNVTLAFFSGEEQGLVGSKAYAKHLRAQNVGLAFQMQIDMIAHKVEGEP